MKGIILVNKDKNCTSRDVVNELSHFFHLKKVGHTGTLDPLATGILVIALGRYTKLINELSSLTKEYTATVKVGIKTDTLDITGNILEKGKYDLDEENIKSILNSFVGKYHQVIPIYSAKKVNGKKLYEYAREKKEVTLPENDVEIYDISLLDVKDDEFTFKVNVSKGTYIRSLIQSICDKLGIIGVMSVLKRTKQGIFDINDSYTIEDIKNNNYKILSLKEVTNYKIYELSDSEYEKVLNGNKLVLDLKENKIIMTYKNEEIALYSKQSDKFCLDVLLKVKK